MSDKRKYKKDSYTERKSKAWKKGKRTHHGKEGNELKCGLRPMAVFAVLRH